MNFCLSGSTIAGVGSSVMKWRTSLKAMCSAVAGFCARSIRRARLALAIAGVDLAHQRDRRLARASPRER